MTAIGNDAAETIDADLSESDAADVFLKRLMPEGSDAETPSKAGANEEDETPKPETEEADEDSAEKPEATEDTEETEEDKSKRKFADDDATYVKIKVGDETHEVAVKDLSRLFGQEKALTQKSMEVATQRKAADEEFQRNTAATAALLERAKARFEPYSKVDFLLASKELSTEEYTALRNEAQKAYEDVEFLEKNLNGLVQGVQKKQHEERITTARETIKVLSGPVEKGGIEGWNEKVYDSIRAYGVSQGLPEDVVRNLVDAPAIRLIHKAMLFDRGKSKVVTTKVNKTPTKVVKTTTSPAVTRGTQGATEAKKAMTKLQRSGSQDDAAAAILARWGVASDD